MARCGGTGYSRSARRLESQRSETGPPPGVTSRQALLCKERGAPFGPPQILRPQHHPVLMRRPPPHPL